MLRPTQDAGTRGSCFITVYFSLWPHMQAFPPRLISCFLKQQSTKLLERLEAQHQNTMQMLLTYRCCIASELTNQTAAACLCLAMVANLYCLPFCHNSSSAACSDQLTQSLAMQLLEHTMGFVESAACRQWQRVVVGSEIRFGRQCQRVVAGSDKEFGRQ